MEHTAVNRHGESIPILTLDTTTYQTVDGTAGHAESTVLEPGIYRIAICESTANNAFINVTPTGVAAETEKGAYMPLGLVEYVYITVNSKFSVVDGKLNIVKVF